MNTTGNFVNTDEFRIIVPVYNEGSFLKKSETISFFNSLKFKTTFVVAGDDDSYEILENESYHCLKYDGVPSIGCQLKFALHQISEKEVLILPIDCQISNKAIAAINYGNWGGFKKKYDESSLMINIYLFLQNFFRTRFFKNYVWTNGIYAKKEDLLRLLPETGFLDDLILSDRLKKLKKPVFINQYIVASYRRYKKNGLRQIYTNLYILINYRLKLKDIEDLKAIYTK